MRATAMKKVIYDFGANNGVDIPYYLLKADLVIAVEANPKLCAQIQDRFSNARFSTNVWSLKTAS